MQFDDLQPSFAPLPAPPALERYFLESPLIVVGAMLIAAVAAFFIFNARSRLKLGSALAGAGVLLAVGVWVLAAVVVTERERLAERTRELIDATASADTAALAPMLAERAEARLPSVPGVPSFSTRAQIVAAVDLHLRGEFRIRSHSVAQTRGVIDGPRTARSQVRVRHEAPGLPGVSWWEIDWRREGPGAPWVADAVELLWAQGIGNF